MGFLKRLFGNKAAADDRCVEPAVTSSPHGVSDSYFDTMLQMREAVSKRDFDGAARLVRKNLREIPEWVEETRRQFGSFDISSVPALEQGGTVLALVGDDEGLAEMGQLIASAPELEPWGKEVDRHLQDRVLVQEILKAVIAHPNCLQTDIKGLVGEADGHRVANLIGYLEKAGKIARVKTGRTYVLLLAGSPNAPAPPVRRSAGSHRTDGKPPSIREIDISSLAYVPLPRSAPHRRDTEADRDVRVFLRPGDHFAVQDADWRISSVEKLQPAERPDPAFRQIHPTDNGLLMIDDLGKAEGLGPIEAAALRYDRRGNLAAKAGLAHGVYRVGVHPCGRGLIAMSKDCVVHAYSEDLGLIFETALREAPEIQAVAKRFDIDDEELRRHIRCVALSRDVGRYLFTAVDEAWCIDASGTGLWGAKLPITEGWTREVPSSDAFGNSADVEQALDVMKLSLPTTPEDVKRRYRELVKRWHPDLHPGDPYAEQMMKAVNSAAEVLTGLDVHCLGQQTEGWFFRQQDRTVDVFGGVTVTMTLGLVREISASDWIYAAGFAAESDSVYLAGYSGRVVLVNEEGQGVRAYDIGSVPRRIVDTGDYLYLLTDTTLYVLRDDALHALLDAFGAEFVVAQTGFGLLERYMFRWFLEDGRYVGSIISKDPIRRVYSAPGGMIVETRQRRAFVGGVPGWWE